VCALVLGQRISRLVESILDAATPSVELGVGVCAKRNDIQAAELVVLRVCDRIVLGDRLSAARLLSFSRHGFP
jgi:hypothetical protein